MLPPSASGPLIEGVDDEVFVAIIGDFYERMLRDQRVAHFFAGVSPAQIRAHQRHILLAAVAGPDLFNHLTLEQAHVGLRLSDEHFDIAVGHLGASLREVGLREALVATILGKLEPIRAYVVAPVHARARRSA